MNLYARSAPYYDLIYDPLVDSEREADLLEEIFRRYARRPVQRVLDLGCGTGTHATALASRGYEVLGVDRNETFIALAEEKTRDWEGGPRFVLGDMRDPGTMGGFDALIIMLGAFDHLPRPGAEDALRGFRDHLEPGGILAFEWWNEQGAVDGYQDWLERKGEGIRLIRLGQGKVDTTAHTLEITLKHLVLRDERVEEAFTERDTMALYGAEEMEALLSRAGLTPLAMLDWTRKALDPHRPDDFQVLAVARRDG